ncbi:peroxidase 44-like [Oryza glaberrima]|uniref:peroxidase n=1 Tax=Oryza glaberrima TaxID=4538 RepID=I1P7N5_ORYGL|nr:peroxidase 44-like [Oryza glaberrima]
MDTRLPLLLLLAGVVAAAAPLLATAQLSADFYSSTCPNVEKVVSTVIERKFKEDPTTSALLLRLLFHDCFANGCDASILIDPLSNQSAEKEAGPNISVKGYDIIDEIKTELEKECPQVVSCADIVALSTRDSVRLAGGPNYDVPTGRRDSLVSNREEGDSLPGPDIAVPKLMAQFSEKGFSADEMVVLLAGGHSIGKAKCFFIEVDAAPIDPTYRSNITAFCDGKDGDKGAVPLDPITPDVVDPNYFELVMDKKMPLTIDRLMGMDARTKPIVESMGKKTDQFDATFGKAMTKLSGMKVITGKDGEIRKSCSEFNNPVNTDDGPSVIRISSLNPEEMMGSFAPATGKSPSAASESRKVAPGGAMEERMAAGEAKTDASGGAMAERLAAGEAKTAAAASEDENQAAGDEAAAEEEGTKSNKKKAERVTAEVPADEAAPAAKKPRAMGGQSFSMAGAGAGGEPAKKSTAMKSQSFSMASQPQQ